MALYVQTGLVDPEKLFAAMKKAKLTGTTTKFPGAWYILRVVRRADARLKKGK